MEHCEQQKSEYRRNVDNITGAFTQQLSETLAIPGASQHQVPNASDQHDYTLCNPNDVLPLLGPHRDVLLMLSQGFNIK